MQKEGVTIKGRLMKVARLYSLTTDHLTTNVEEIGTVGQIKLIAVMQNPDQDMTIVVRVKET